MKIKLLLIALFFTSLLFQSCSKLVITNINLFDPVSCKMLPDRTVIVNDERIEAVSDPANPVKIPVFSKVIDGSGKYVIPGLIDAHVHLVFLTDLVNVKGEDILPLYLGNGVTSVRCIGDQIAPQKAVADFAHKHPETCPTIFLSSPLIDGPKPMHSAGYTITDTARVPGFIDTLITQGISTLKLYVGLDSMVFKKVIVEGHKRGLPVAAHLPSGKVKSKRAISWGLDIVEHIWGIPNDSLLIDKMARQGTMVDPTLVVFRNMIYLPDLPEVYNSNDLNYVPDTLRKSWEQYLTDKNYNEGNREPRQEKMNSFIKITRALHSAGVIILAGTDSPEPYCPPGFSMHTELMLLVESGLSPAEALRSATVNNATALKQSGNLGSIEAGKIADMVILNSDPLSDIRNTRDIKLVIHNGIICDPGKVMTAPAVHEK